MCAVLYYLSLTGLFLKTLFYSPCPRVFSSLLALAGGLHYFQPKWDAVIHPVVIWNITVL